MSLMGNILWGKWGEKSASDMHFNKTLYPPAAQWLTVEECGCTGQPFPHMSV